MPTILSHPAVILALRPIRMPSSIYLAGAICTVLPDLDVIGFRYGIRYGDLLGHRGLTHSIPFALVVSGCITWIMIKISNQRKMRFSIFIFLFLCTASHGILDAFTDGGLGVAFFSPFSNERYFFPWRPLEVSPISIHHFLSGPVFNVLRSELIFIWLPCLVMFVAGLLLRKQKNI